MSEQQTYLPAAQVCARYGIDGDDSVALAEK